MIALLGIVFIASTLLITNAGLIREAIHTLWRKR